MESIEQQLIQMLKHLPVPYHDNLGKWHLSMAGRRAHR